MIQRAANSHRDKAPFDNNYPLDDPLANPSADHLHARSPKSEKDFACFLPFKNAVYSPRAAEASLIVVYFLYLLLTIRQFERRRYTYEDSLSFNHSLKKLNKVIESLITRIKHVVIVKPRRIGWKKGAKK
ncbi:hypothetical protein CEXT_504761 [Caerostris extrusa]|uniref:Uncharacterized protein n=1 Tax=Caerostris extrusa TaxID=172846 RepID=A0AAV4TYC7_CAEEX|nr:hypothetical protein CEXT_504761 [Caerostris extrusa]